MAPATSKRRKTQPTRYHCQSCMTDRVVSQFPEYNPTEQCSHLINTCTACLKKWVEAQIDAKAFDPRIRCPECEEKMDGGDVRLALSKKAFARYEELERRYTAENTPGWRWCLAAGCRAGQVHTKPVAEDESPKPSPDKSPPGKKGKQRPTTTTTTKWLSKSGNKKVKTEPENEAEPNKKKEEATAAAPAPDIFTCNSCGAKACVPCDRPWHENESCAEYQARIKDRLAEEDATLATMERSTKKCPRCEKRIEKDGGCAHMYCTRCYTQFCWNCMRIIGQDGRYCDCGRIPGAHG